MMDGKQYLDTEFDSSQWGHLHLRRKDGSLTTSSPSPGDYLRAYQRLSQKAQSVLCITFSPFMGMAYKSATIAAEMAKELLPQTTVKVIDSRTVAAGQLLLVLSAAKAAAQGKSLEEIACPSRDNTFQVAKRYADKVFHISRPGASSARNFGASVA